MKKQIFIFFLVISFCSCSFFKSDASLKLGADSSSTSPAEAQLINTNGDREITSQELNLNGRNVEGSQDGVESNSSNMARNEERNAGYYGTNPNVNSNITYENVHNQDMQSQPSNLDLSAKLANDGEEEIAQEELEKRKIKQEAIKKYHRDRDNTDYVNTLRERGLDARVDKRGIIINLEDALFSFNSAELTPDAVATIQEIADFIHQINKREITVEGHTDSVGTVMFNKQLSEQRALNVANELVANGVSKNLISSRGYGESDPVATNRTEEGRMKNRRVEVIIKQE